MSARSSRPTPFTCKWQPRKLAFQKPNEKRYSTRSIKANNNMAVWSQAPASASRLCSNACRLMMAWLKFAMISVLSGPHRAIRCFSGALILEFIFLNKPRRHSRGWSMHNPCIKRIMILTALLACTACGSVGKVFDRRQSATNQPLTVEASTVSLYLSDIRTLLEGDAKSQARVWDELQLDFTRATTTPNRLR